MEGRPVGKGAFHNRMDESRVVDDVSYAGNNCRHGEGRKEMGDVHGVGIFFSL